MLAINEGQVTALVDPHTKVADLQQKYGKSIIWKRTAASRREGPLSVQDAKNARREADYVARRNGIKEPLLQLWEAK